MIAFPNAKINIGLNILNKREDGYHNIESIFYPVGWRDALEVTKASQFELKATGLIINGKLESNLIYKAYELLKSHIPKSQNFCFHLHKVIPMGAGLGGGSSDGAFALKLIKDFFNLNLPLKTLEALAEKLGSDCPFFIQNKPVFSHDRGIKFEPISLDLSSYYVVIINPNIHIGTAEAYSLIQPKKTNLLLKESILKPIEDWKELIVNDFEAPLMLKYPLLSILKSKLYEMGAIYASMTGSGSSMYGIFNKEIELNQTFTEFTVWQGKLSNAS
jgi:4-diphosphocytidyl-2-C-methyl-D-erythritol kinase